MSGLEAESPFNEQQDIYEYHYLWVWMSETEVGISVFLLYTKETGSVCGGI